MFIQQYIGQKEKKYEDCRSAIVMLEAIATNDALYCVTFILF
jgi:hypothetical protein